MRDPVSTERISAYLDGELSLDERQLVERQLAESEEHRQLLEELEAVRADLQALPSFAAPPDLQARIAAQIEASQAADESPVAATPPAAIRSWRTMAIAAATLAAVVTVFLLLPGPQPPIDPTTPRPVPVHLKKLPQHTAVIEITLTAAGHERKAIEEILEKLGIGLDPTMRLSAELADDLLALKGRDIVRMVPYKDAAPRDGAGSEVEMIYLSGSLFKIDQLWFQTLRMRKAGQDVTDCRMAVVMQDRQLEVMRNLHESARGHFARSPTTGGPSEEAYAFKLNFGFRIASIGVPGTASFSMPAVSANVEQAVASASSPNEGDPTTAQDNSSAQTSLARPEPTAEEQAKATEVGVDLTTTGHVLLVLRTAPAEAE